MISTYFLDSLLSWTTSSRRWRLRLPVLWLSRCFLPAWWRLSFPEAVTRKRLRDALWVFILGMVTPWVPAGAASFGSPARGSKTKRAPGLDQGGPEGQGHPATRL